MIEKKPRYILGRKDKTVSILSLLHGSNIFGGGSGIAAKKEVLLSIPFNNDLYSEDFDWWIRIIFAGIKIKYIPISLVRYRVHKKNMTSNFAKIFTYNLKIFNRLFIYSIVLLLSFLIGYVKSSLSLISKIIKLLSFKILYLIDNFIK